MLNTKTTDTHLRLNSETKNKLNELSNLTNYNISAVISIAVSDYYNRIIDNYLSASDLDKEV